jgi:Tfp pilus assembly protein PilN
MIKVNLLRDQTARVRKTFSGPTISRTGLIFVAILLLASAGMGTWWYSVKQEVRTCTEKRKRLRIEEQRLQSLKKEIEKFEKLKQMRQSRIDIIEKLKENQTGPVLLLNTVIQSIPSDGTMWLTSLAQKDDLIRLVGFTPNTDVIPDFINNLAASGYFKTVDLEQIESQKEASKFSLVCTSGKKHQAE